MAVFLYEERHKIRAINAECREELVNDPIADLPEERFRELYRMTPDLARTFLDEMIAEGFESNSTISLEHQFCAVLNYYATGCYQRRALATSQMSESVVGKLIHTFSEFISDKLGDKYIKFPLTVQEKVATAERFERLHGIPGVIGLVDGTHIAVGQLPKNQEWAYVNRKGFDSINTQIICDADLKITSVNARYPGSTHDSSIWKSCLVHCHFYNEFEHAPEQHSTWLLGDSGYALQPWLMTPVSNPNTNELKHFNKMHAKTRSKVERCIGVLKNRFRCLLGERVLLYNHEKSANVIVSCVVLHNFLRSNLDEEDDEEEVFEDILVNPELVGQAQTTRGGRAVRERLANTLYQNRR